ncbi:MAG: sigma-70 family RNA polymerase sigma factor [Myxococcaceae bacterium]
MSLGAQLVSQLGTAPALEDWLNDGHEKLLMLWPDLALQPEPLAKWLKPHLSPKSESLDAAGLLLAAGALSQQASAVSCFDQLLRAEVKRAVGPLDKTNALVDEATQLVRERLLFGGGAPKLAEYSGQGALAAWLRAVAVRMALNAKRVGAREDAVAALPDTAIADPNPELALLRARHRAEFKEAFGAAIAKLSARERTLMRLTSLDGLTLAQVGQMYGKDQSTVSRWLAAARQTLLEATREQLAVKLSLTSSELESVMRAADSELNLSISRLLQSSER